jgi:alpha/beta superfamily hydrolase
VPRLRLIIVGDRDEFCPLPQLHELLTDCAADLRPEIKVVPGSSHFFAGREKELYKILLEYPLTQ